MTIDGIWGDRPRLTPKPSPPSNERPRQNSINLGCKPNQDTVKLEAVAITRNNHNGGSNDTGSGDGQG